MKPVLIAPPYTGPMVACLQCGHAGASTRCVHYADIGPALQRNCGRCDYMWTERAATTEPAGIGQYA